MANLDISNVYGTVDKRKGAGTVADPGAVNISGNLLDITNMRTRLTAINATTYSAKNLDKMTHNDMRYAIRLNDDPTSGVNG